MTLSFASKFLVIFILFKGGSLALHGTEVPEALHRMTLAAGLRVQLVASEPMITQPVCLEFDFRGRLWVVQYLQYPNPAGLQRVQVDRWSRTRYDQVPDPPPLGPRGSDRITILEDSDFDGRADSAHDFLNGLNLATGIAFGHGGVYVLNVPYLLFYPDRNRDDVPDGAPEVCLSGFGMEDAHSVANSLTWGPDGWLYGCQGSTVTARIRGVEFQQGIWRYHPLTHEFELFCEGGGNAWGLDFDETGELIYSTNVGGFRNVHGVQGAYYWKSVGKHGALHNPYAYGYFDHVPHTNFAGGHVTDGGLIYQGTNLPTRYRGRFVCGDLLGHGVQWHEMFPWGSSFTSAHGGYLLQANDTWFAPSDLAMAPDGALYVADWHDQRTAHPDPDAAWDRSNGRVYRISLHPALRHNLPDFHAISTPTLISLLVSPNPWITRQARRTLAERRDPESILPLRSALRNSPTEHLALEYLWALHVSGGLNETMALETLQHGSAAVRKWSVRLIGDQPPISPSLVSALVHLAKEEPDVRVRSQLAATAKRLSAEQGLPIIENLLRRDVDGHDPFIPLLLWWAIEQHSIHHLALVEQFFNSADAWRSSLASTNIVPRLIRRWAAEGTGETLEASVRLIRSAPEDSMRSPLWSAMAQGLRDSPPKKVEFGTGGLFARSSVSEPPEPPRRRHRGSIPAPISEQLGQWWRDDTMDLGLVEVASLIGLPEGKRRAHQIAADPQLASAMRIEMIRLLGELAVAEDVAFLAEFITDPSSNASVEVQLACLDALGGYEDPALGTRLLKQYQHVGPRVRVRLFDLLLSRKSWAEALLLSVDAGQSPAADLTLEQLRRIASYHDSALDHLVRKHWGTITRGTPEESLAEMRRLNNDLNAGAGNAAAGRNIFERTCANCHQFFGKGGNIGPDLTHANRSDREFLLSSLVDPSAVIRKEYLTHEIKTDDGRVMTAVIVNQADGQWTLGVSTGERISLPQSKVASLQESAHSLMPEGLLNGLKPQEVRDLFAYLQSPNPISVSP